MYEAELEEEMFDLEDPLGEGDPFLGDLIGAIGPVLGSLLGEEEEEFPGEDELGLFEDEMFENGLAEAEAEVLMELLVDQIAEAESEEEADQFLPVLAALAPLAAKAASALVPVAARVAKRVVPQLARGVVSVGRRMLRSRAGRQAIRTLPVIARGAARDVLTTVARGRPVTGSTVRRALARQTARVLRDPRKRRACIHRSRRIVRTVKPRVVRAARSAG